MKGILKKSHRFGMFLLLIAGTFSCGQSQDPLRVIKFGQDSISYARKIIDEMDNSWALQKYSKYVYDNYDNQIVSQVSIVLSSDSSYLGSEISLWPSHKESIAEEGNGPG